MHHKLQIRHSYAGLAPFDVYNTFHVFRASIHLAQIQPYRLRGLNNTQTSMLSGIPDSAMCVQRFDDSRNYAIHITFRNSLRSSSLRDPRDPLLKVVFN